MHRILALAAALLFPASVATAQQPSDTIRAQQAAMHKLSFLAGDWSGPVTVALGPGEPLHLTQTEKVEYKLDGLVMLIQGKSTAPDGHTPFEALAIVSFDDTTHTYRFRAYNAGHYVDAELTPLPDGFSWGFDAGPAHVVNTMHLTEKGEWQETTQMTYGSNPPLRSVTMLLTRKP